jgi:glycine/D-amino acid oxidase-like deaminating enzyme
LVEGRTVGSGITSGTTAVLSTLHDPLCQDLAARFGQEVARLYVLANWEALEKYRTLAQRYACSWEERPHYRYAMTQAQAERLKVEAELLGSLGFAAAYHKETPLPFPVAGALYLPGMAQFHPLQFLYGLASGLNIRENTPVLGISNGAAFTERGRILARKIIVATHFPLGRFRGLYFMKLYQRRSYVIALEGGPDVEGTYAGMGASGISLRNAGNLLFLSGGRHRTGGKGSWETVRSFAARHFPELPEGYAWANQDCMTLDGLPYVGLFSPHTPDLYVATGFGAWGMTNSMAAATLLADLVQGKKSPYASVYTPSRSMLRPQLLSNLGHTVSNFLRLTPKRCSHMGCALKWNPAEHSWDCPCHGSRFTADGSVLDGPAQSRVDLS